MIEKLSYRDRIVLLVVIVIVLFGLTFFLLIRPAMEETKALKTELIEETKKWDDIEAKISQNPRLTQEVNETRLASLRLQEGFTEKMEDVKAVDRYLQPYINGSKITGFTIPAGGVSFTYDVQTAIPFYYNTPDEFVIYPIWEAADLNGSLNDEMENVLAPSQQMATRTAEAALGSTATFTVQGTRAEIYKMINRFANGLDESGAKTTRLVNVDIDDYSFGKYKDYTDEMKNKATCTFQVEMFYIEPPTEMN
jgi:predicted Holliday junction resolvase-like endonuclease